MTDLNPKNISPQKSIANLLSNKPSVTFNLVDVIPEKRERRHPRTGVWTVLVCRSEFEELEQVLTNIKTLRRLNCRYIIDLIEIFARALKVNTSVETLNFAGNSQQEPNDMINRIFQLLGDILQHNSSITALETKLLNGDINDDSFFAFTNGLRKNKSLRALSTPHIYKQNQVIELIEAIKEQKGITFAKFPRFNIISHERMKALALLIQGNVIKNIEIEDKLRSVVHDELVPVFEALKETTSVKDLTIQLKEYWQRPKDPLMSIKECHSFAEALKSNNSLTRLGIKWNLLGSERISIILNGLQQHRRIETIDFCENSNLDDKVAPSIGALLTHNRSLTELKLKDAKFTAEGCKYIAEGLKKNKSVYRFDMEEIDIGYEGCKYMAEALKVNRTLIYMSLNCKDLNGAKILADALIYNPTLRYLGVKDCNKSTDTSTSDAFLEALKYNTSVMYLGLYYGQIFNVEQKKQLESLLERNRQFRKDVITNTIMILIQLGRSETMNAVLPTEIWLRIFKHITCTSIPSFKRIAEQILLHSDLLDLKSLCKKRLRRVKGKTCLV